MSSRQFACDKCDVVDMFDLAYPDPDRSPVPGQPLRCTLCQGKDWHGAFDPEIYDPGQHQVENRNNNVGLS